MCKTISITELGKPLEAYIQSGNLNFIIGSGASLPAIPLMGNIERQINDLLVDNQEIEANKIAINFIQNLESQSILQDLGLNGDNTETTLSNYINFLSIIDDLLFERKNLLLSRQANIFTTNYDLFFEYGASKNPSLILNDGFDRASSIDGNFRFTPEQYLDRTYRSAFVYTRQSEVPTVNLFKLHGSVNWQRSKNEITLLKNLTEPLLDEELDNHLLVSETLQKKAMILPSLGKFRSSLLDRVYYDLLRFFANSIERENSILISFGFSFCDEHILDITRRSLRNPTSQLIIFCYNNDSVADLQLKFLQQRNVLVVSPEINEVTDFKKFNSVIKSVIPVKGKLNE